jgi:hypothetical protein
MARRAFLRCARVALFLLVEHSGSSLNTYVLTKINFNDIVSELNQGGTHV